MQLEPMLSQQSSGNRLVRPGFLALLAMASIVGNGEAANNVLTPAEEKAGFKLLFDGKSTAQWTLNWPIEDSAMKSPNTGAMIYSKEEFSNFEWKVDVKVNSGGNSGLFIRTKNDWYCDCFEVGILDSKSGGDADERSNSANGDKLPAGIFNVNKGTNFVAGSNAPIKRTGAIYDIYPTTVNGITIPNGGTYVDLMKPAMQWNSMVVWANGKYIESWLNGMKVTDFEIGTQDWFNRFHRSKFGNNNNQCGDDYATLPSGKLVVQDHGHGLTVWMRNIKIRPITPGEKMPSPLVSPNGGNISGPTKVILDNGVTGSVIRYTLDGSNPTENSPVYNDSTGILLNTAATLKARAYRARFTASDVTTATFTGGTGIGANARFNANTIAIAQNGKVVELTSNLDRAMVAEILAPDGRILSRNRFDGIGKAWKLSNLESGLYVLRTRAAGLSTTRILAIP